MLHDVLQRSYGERYMPSTKVMIPPTLVPIVLAVNLDSVTMTARVEH